MKEVPAGDTENSSGDIGYAYKASLMGAPSEFHLAADALEWRKGGYSSRVPYGRIRRVRLGFRPVTMQNYRFLTEIWPEEGPKLQIASTSWKSLVEHERFDAAYRDFVTEMMRRIGAAGGRAQLQTGSPPFIYWPGVVILGGVLVGIVVLIFRALQTDAWSGAAFLAAFLAFFLWQALVFFGRNRPRTFLPDAVPEQVLPKG